MIEMKASPAVKLDTLSDVNDLGKPWRFEEGDLTVTRLSPWSAPGCHPAGCGLKVYTNKEGKVVKVEGDENHPVPQGRLCVRCLTLKDYMYNPSRVLKPIKRNPKFRGHADKWEECSWDEALDIIQENYDRLTKHYGRETCVVFVGTGPQLGRRIALRCPKLTIAGLLQPAAHRRLVARALGVILRSHAG